MSSAPAPAHGSSTSGAGATDGSGSTGRTPQVERTRAMRQRLMEATVECLVEHGWGGTTTIEVSRRAGVSRGAQLHHFPSKNDLVIAAVEHLSEVRRQEMNAALADLPTKNRTRAVLGLLAEHFTGPVFFAALELWVAARTDEALHEAVATLERRTGRVTHAYALELLGIDDTVGRNRELVQATLDLMRGLGLAAAMSDDTARRGRILDAWARVLDAEIEKGTKA
ncbi:TetR family transcriptional regulator [Knoellia remsis]|uniref:TetR family transcriptional regulator n=1 Tax=Knoellia remsis TaxID=407159 RepID=A0A2T0V0Z1_9MICO|nr:TetR/AcrR family transcriptional regulator [Knoellia remsis]PRY63824.1 TetR family transcriptional regulator [Knoellia remsis]